MALTPEQMQEIIKDTFLEFGARTYVGMRYVPKFVGDWDGDNEYEPLSIVYHSGRTYTSKCFVPVGVSVTNTSFWAISYEYVPSDAQLQAAIDAWLDAHPEATTTVQDNSINGATKIIDGSIPDSKLNQSDGIVAKFNAFIDGNALAVDFLTDASLVSGDYALGTELSNPNATQFRKAYNLGFELSDDMYFIADTDGAYKIAFSAFDEDGICIGAPTVWLSDGTYTAAQIKANARSDAGVKYAFQIKSSTDLNISTLTIHASDYYKLIADVQYQIGADSIKPDSIDESRLTESLREELGIDAHSEILENSYLTYKSYAVNDTLNNPSQGATTRASYLNGFTLSDDLVFTASTSNTYQVAFCAFDSNDVCISVANAWLNDGTYSAAEIMRNARSSAGAKYTFMIRRSDNAALPSISTLTYYSLRSSGNITEVDLFMFMGQSNMAGRGEYADSPAPIPGAGWEYRAISSPNMLYPMTEPFGVTESNPSGIDEGSSKTGDMVVSFTNAYYRNTNVPIVGISASKGGTTISQWQPNGAYLTDAMNRLSSCVSYLTSKGYGIRHKYVLWCQGESDGDISTTAETYKTLFDTMLDEMISNGIEKLFMVRIGNYNSAGSTRYDVIMNCQTEIAQTNTSVVMASTDLAGMRDRGLMKDSFHYYQAGYNEIGEYAGVNVGIYVNTQKEPTMYDTKDGSLYYTHKN